MNPAPWSHHEPVEIRFGAGCLEQLPAHSPHDPVLLVTTPGMTRRGLTERVEGLLQEREVIVYDRVGPNPTIKQIEAAKDHLQERDINALVAIGGGSVLDTAKTLSLLLVPSNHGVSLDTHFQEKKPLPENIPLPLVAMPTTAGTGSEVTPFATVWDDERKKKQSFTTPHLHPSAALLDPELTRGLPAQVTLPSGLDALSHAMESVWNQNATPVTRLYAQRAVRLILEHLPRVLKEPLSLPDRSRMLEASLLAGLAIATTRTALAHSISYPLTAHYGLTHGYACSFTLPALLRFNAQEDDGRLKELAQASGRTDPQGLARAVEDLYAETGAAGAVREAVADRDALLSHLDEMFTPERAGNNLRKPQTADVEAILQESAENVLGM